ncbi:MAG TPA: ester cyclase [Thermomicrobiales bacterium]|jgi:predicted ester cyclase|nr:ester cyclase [Thermomicrobiales bacterium]
MSEQDPKEIARRYYEEIFQQRNLDALDQIISPDFRGYSASFGEYTRKDMRRDIQRDHDNMPTDEIIIDEQIAEGDRVTTRWTYRWKHDASLFGEKPTHRWLSMEGVHIDQIADGRIVQRWEVKDFFGVAKQLDLAVGPAIKARSRIE